MIQKHLLQLEKWSFCCFVNYFNIFSFGLIFYVCVCIWMKFAQDLFTCLEKPCAAAVPDSGTELTISASTGCSIANCLPHCNRTAYTICPSNILSDRAKYTYSKIQNACVLLSGLSTISIVRIPCRVISIISPGNTSRTYWAPIERKPQDSDDTTQPSASRDSSQSPSSAKQKQRLR